MRPSSKKGVNLVMMRRFHKETLEGILRGSNLSSEEIRLLEDRISVMPDDRGARLALLGAHLATQDRRTAQVLWFIEHEPWTSLGQHSMIPPGAPADAASELWRNAVAKHRDDARVVENAAWFFGMHDPAFGSDILEAHCRASVNDADRWGLLAVYLDFVAQTRPERAVVAANGAIDAAFKALRLGAATEDRGVLAVLMRNCARKTGQNTCARLLDLAIGVWEARVTGDDSVLPQLDHVFAGLIFLAQENVEEASLSFAKATRHCCPREELRTLASELVKSGAREAVIQVLDEAAEAHAASATTIQAWLSGFAQP